MSEFTDGLLVLKEHAPLVQAALADLEKPHIFQDLNEKWSVILVEHQLEDDDSVYSWALRHSADFPMLYFENGESVWSYIIFHVGQEKASVEVKNYIDHSFYKQIAQILYPRVRDIHSDLDKNVSKTIYRLVRGSDGYKKELRDQYSHANVNEFAVFGVSAENIEGLREYIRVKWCRKPIRDSLWQVDIFKELIGIDEMTWKSYRYAMRDKEEGRF
jgi:hypothetical protein